MSSTKGAFKVETVKGSYVRADSTLRNWIKNDPKAEFPAEKGRYHLYVSYACPWASRALAVRKLKGLEDIISLSVTAAVFEKTKESKLDGHYGWVFKKEGEERDVIPDTINGVKTIRELYEKFSGGNYEGRFTVPVLFDKKTKRIVNNESSEIIRMLNSEFNAFAKNPNLDLYPENLREKIDEVNEWIYHDINNGVYKSGFATTQQAYDKAVNQLFESLDRAEQILSKSRYLVSNDQYTEADIRFFVTLIRFDAVYVQHFKCNKYKISDYPNLENYTREIYQIPGISETVNFWHIKNHYCRSHSGINPYGIVPLGPIVDYTLPHNRADKEFSSL